MHNLSWFNNSIVRLSKTSILPVSSAVFYGKGVFTSIAIYNAKPFLWDKHWRRLTGSAAKFGIDLSQFPKEATRKALAGLIEKNQVTDGRARITFFDESLSQVWSSETETKTSLLITTADLRSIPEHFKLTISPHRINTTSPLAGIKSCNYLENLMALDEAKSRGFDETIRLNERCEVASTAAANVFWLANGTLYTPSLETGCLAGTTREYILENLDCEEVKLGIEALQKADGIFLTSTGVGVVRVAEFEGRSLAGSGHPITNLVSIVRL